MEQHPLPSPPDSDPRRLVENLFSILGVLGRGWRYIAVSVAITLMLAVIHVARAKPSYEASARLLILQQGGGHPLNVGGSQVATGGDPFESANGYSNSLATHVMVIRSPLIVERAVALGGLDGVSAGAIIGGLSVKLPDAEARVLELNYKAGSRDESVRVVDAVIRSYDRFLKDNYQKNSHEVIGLIIKARDELSAELKKLEQEYLEFRKKSPAHGGNGEGHTFVARRLDQWDQAINQAMARSLLLKSQLALGRELAEEGAGVAAVTNALNQLSGLGGDIKFAPELPDSGGGAGLSYERLEAELSDVELRRQMAEELIAQLESEQLAAASSSKVDEAEVVQAFHADPQVAQVAGELRKARARYDQSKRMSRLASDPSVMNSAKRTKELEEEIGRLWKQRRPAIVAQLLHTGDDQALGQAEAELRALKAKESTLRKQCEQLRSDRLRQLHQERDQLAGRVGPGHEKVRALEGQIARLEERSEQAAGPGQPQTHALLGAIERGLKSVEAMRAEIEERFRRDLSESKEAEIGLLAESNLRNNLERQRTLFNSVVDQLKQAQLVSDYGSVTAQVLNPPVATEKRQSKASVLFAALVLGLGLGGGLAFVADLLDARVRSLSEIRKVLDLRVLGIIPQLSRDQLAPDVVPGLISHTTPRSLMAESYKSVRTSLDLIRRNLDARVILVTSPQSGDGKSTTASNLAICLAHAGRRVLLIDADLRRPTQHTIHGLRRSPGLTHVLKDVLPCHRVVQRTPIENLDLLAAGPAVSNPAELLASPRLASFVEEVRQAYDLVIIDSSPLLAVTDPAILAPVVDGIALVVRISATRHHDLVRTVELLPTLGTPVFGAVINGIVREQFGLGYNYAYGYIHGYGSYGGQGGEETTAPMPLAELTVSRTGHPTFGFNGTNGTNGTADHPAAG